MTENLEKKHCDCKKNNDSALIKRYFEYSYKFIIFSFVVTFLAMLVSKKDNIRLILFIEILITGISGYMYYLFTKSMNETKEEPDLHYINVLRYKGWSFSTPLMMTVLCLVLSASTNIALTLRTLLAVIGLDYVMLLFGYLGELGKIDRISATVLGFIPFFAMFYIIFTNRFSICYSNNTMVIMWMHLFKPTICHFLLLL